VGRGDAEKCRSLDSLRSLGMTAIVPSVVIPSTVEGSALVLSIHDIKLLDGPWRDLCAERSDPAVLSFRSASSVIRRLGRQ